MTYKPRKKICRWTAIAQPLIVYIVALFHQPLVAVLTHTYAHTHGFACALVCTQDVQCLHSLSLSLASHINLNINVCCTHCIFLIVTLFVEIRSHCQIKCVYACIYGCIQMSCIHCMLPLTFVHSPNDLLFFTFVAYLFFLFQYLRWDGSMHVCIWMCVLVFLPSFPQRLAYLACSMLFFCFSMLPFVA